MNKILDGNNYVFYDIIDIDFYRKIKDKNYQIVKSLKDDKRSKVDLIEIDNKKYVLKVPREKNRRKWQRFISIFRGGESIREFKQLEKLKNNGFNAPKPFLAVEKRKFKMTYDSYFVCEYIESQEGTVEDLDIIIECLNKIHKKGFLHGDSQLTNFLIKNNKVYLIDAKLLNNIYGKFGEMYEYIYLQESCPKDLKDYVDRDNFYFKIAKLLNSYLHFWGRVRKKIKNKG